MPLTQKHQHVQFFKTSRRKDDDIAVVNACFLLETSSVDGEPVQVKDARLAFGGLGPTTVLASKAAAKLIGSTVDATLPLLAKEALQLDLHLDTSAPGGMVEYRESLACSLMYKFLVGVVHAVAPDKVDPRLHSLLVPQERELSCGHQVFEHPIVNRDDGVDTVGVALPHASALEHVRVHCLSVPKLTPFRPQARPCTSMTCHDMPTS